MLLCIALAIAPFARAAEFMDGRVELHGFAEVQLRALDEKFSEELDLAQWYNILNLELEVDLAPEGFGPFDLVTGYVRAEGRYDAIYSEGFAQLFPSLNAYGDHSRRLPKRLRDAKDKEYSGVVPVSDRFGDFEHARIENEQPQRLAARAERVGYPALGSFFRNNGPDNVRGALPSRGTGAASQAAFLGNRGIVKLTQPSDDPARYVHDRILDFRFTFKESRGPANNDTQVLGPWLPKNFVRAQATLRDRGNPFRGRFAPTRPLPLFQPQAESVRSHVGDINSPAGAMASPPATLIVDRLDPLLSQILEAPDDVRVNIDGSVPVAARPLLSEFFFPGQVANRFGGDFMGGVVPCLDPTDADTTARVRAGIDAPAAGARCIPRSATQDGDGELYTDPNAIGIVKLAGGSNERPFSPAPDVGNLGRVEIDTATGEVIRAAESNADLQTPQGLYIPSKGNRALLASGRLDSLELNFDELDRSFNRGQSQQNTKELKEAYLDLEMFDSRLWMRLGKQNIVWGKTELFRTTDQFNPQDLALSSLPTLEESRIALWSARFVYSLYDVGPFEDVRLEFATNIDQFQPADLGACGEPFTTDDVCQLTSGIFAHGITGAGIAGIDRPESPWKEIGDLEFGGRVEWRWNRFSFALTDFYGFSDFPYPEAVFFYERGVDLDTGRPVVARLPGEVQRRCGTSAGEVATSPATNLDYSTSFASHPHSMTPGALGLGPRGFAFYRGGIGWDPDCLRPGGAPFSASGAPEPNAFFFDTETLADTNALYNHPANQQLYAWLCASTIGSSPVFDASACSLNLFSSGEFLNEQLLRIPFVELVAPLLAGEQTGGSGGPNQFLSLASFNQKLPEADVTVPLASLNRLPNPADAPIFDRNNDGAIDRTGCDDPDPDVNQNCDLAGFDGIDTRVDPGSVSNFNVVVQTLDNSLTNEQRALLGCGPFWATRCDTAASFGNYGAFGGIDLLNAEASALVQSWPGIEGTPTGRVFATTDPIYDALGRSQHPGTVAFNLPGAPEGATARFVGGPVCTRFAPGRGGSVRLPGCRGVHSLDLAFDVAGDPETVDVVFEEGYLPSVDGCVIGNRVRRANGDLVQVVPRYRGAGGDAALLARELALCNTAAVRTPVPLNRLDGFAPDGSPLTSGNPACAGTQTPSGGRWQGLSFLLCDAEEVTLEELPLIHPLAGCVDSDAWYEGGGGGAGGCEFFYARDLVDEFFEGTAALFQNEVAAVSWNFLMLLTVTSCDASSFDLDGLNHEGNQLPGESSIAQSLVNDPTCFDYDNPYTPGRCSYASPQYCENVKTLFSTAGVRRNTVRAGGESNSRFGRRTFAWHGGGEAVLDYEKRNVLGFAMDFAEDVSKTNWGMEFTWVENIPFADSDSDVGITRSDAFNFTVSIDRPTFIHFLNPNRTFLFNTQWFFNLVPEHGPGFTRESRFNTLFTFSMLTGYYQDRVLPEFVTVYDIQSRSGALLPKLQYRFTESFSATVGLNYFFGRTQLNRMPINEFAPPSNRVGENAYRIAVENGLSQIRKRDEVYLKLRWTF